MKNILTSCSILAIIAGCTTAAFAGGPDRFAVAEPPPPVDFFSGFTVGVIGSFWDTKFDAFGAGRIVCPNLLPSQTAVDVDGLAVVSVSETCVTPAFSVGFTDLSLAELVGDGVIFTDLGSGTPIPAVAFANNNGSGNDQTGAIGIQASYGRVFPGATWSYYLGIYGGGQWGQGSDNITSAVDLSAFNFTGVTTTIGGFGGFGGLGSFVDGIDDPDNIVEARLNTNVEMKNVYDVGAQVGILLTPQTMGYIKGGAAWSEISTSTTISARFPTVTPIDGFIIDTPLTIAGFGIDLIDTTVPLFNHDVNISGHARASTSDSTELGYEVGFGISQAFTENFIFSLEYMYRDFGNVSAGRERLDRDHGNWFDCGDFFVPFDLRPDNINSGTTDVTIVLPVGVGIDTPATVTVADDIDAPLFYNVTKSSVRVHQSVVNAILSYRFGNLFQ